MHINIDKIWLGIVACRILQKFDGVTALDLHQNFVSAQYLENQFTESYQILYAQQHLQGIAWVCCLSFFAKF